MARRSLFGLGFFSLLAAVVATQACGGSSDGNVPATPTSEAGTGDETGGGDTDGGSLVDAAVDAPADGETIADGGSNIDPDAGTDDAGLDGGPCNTLANGAAPVTSTCVSFAPILGGGALVAGSYFLTHVAALAAPNFCQTKFVPTGFKETLELTVAGGVGTVETATSLAGGGTRHRTSTLTPAAGDKSPLEAAPTCPPGAPTSAGYASALVNGKQELVLRLPYGKGEALYRFEKQ